MLNVSTGARTTTTTTMIMTTHRAEDDIGVKAVTNHADLLTRNVILEHNVVDHERRGLANHSGLLASAT